MDSEETPTDYNLGALNKMMDGKDGENSGLAEETEVAVKRAIEERGMGGFFIEPTGDGFAIGMPGGKEEDPDPWKTMILSLGGVKKTLSEWVSGYTVPALLYRAKNPEEPHGVPKKDYFKYCRGSILSIKRGLSTRKEEAHLVKMVQEGKMRGVGDGNLSFFEEAGKRTGIKLLNSTDLQTFGFGEGLIPNSEEVKAGYDDLYDDITDLCLMYAIKYVNALRGTRRRDIEFAWTITQANFGHIYTTEVPTPFTDPLYTIMTYAIAATMATNIMTSWGSGCKIGRLLSFGGHMSGVEMNLLTARRAKARGLKVWEGENKEWTWDEGCVALLALNGESTSAWAERLIGTPISERWRYFTIMTSNIKFIPNEVVTDLKRLMVKRYDSGNDSMDEDLLKERLLFYGLGVEMPRAFSDGDNFSIHERAVVHSEAAAVIWDAGSNDCHHVADMSVLCAGGIGTQHFVIQRESSEDEKGSGS